MRDGEAHDTLVRERDADPNGWLARRTVLACWWWAAPSPAFGLLDRPEQACDGLRFAVPDGPGQMP